MPEGKEAEIRLRCREQGRVVAMVGGEDGINDGPDLAPRRMWGSPLGAAPTWPLRPGDVTLLGPHLYAIPDAITLSRKSMAIMHQEPLLGLVYNVLGIPVAAGLLYPVAGISEPIWPVPPWPSATSVLGHQQPADSGGCACSEP